MIPWWSGIPSGAFGCRSSGSKRSGNRRNSHEVADGCHVVTAANGPPQGTTGFSYDTVWILVIPVMVWLSFGKELYMEQRMVVTVEMIGAQLRSLALVLEFRRSASQRIAQKKKTTRSLRLDNEDYGTIVFDLDFLYEGLVTVGKGEDPLSLLCFDGGNVPSKPIRSNTSNHLLTLDPLFICLVTAVRSDNCEWMSQTCSGGGNSDRHFGSTGDSREFAKPTLWHILPLTIASENETKHGMAWNLLH